MTCRSCNLQGWSRGWALIALVSILAMPVAVAGTQGASDPRFEVASVRQNTSDQQGMAFRLLPGGRLRVSNHSLRWLVARAYGRDIRVVLEGPDWIDHDRFDIEATFDNDPGEDQSRVLAMLRSLLADRFQLRVRIEERESRYYALRLANQARGIGDGIRPSTVDCEAYRERLERGSRPNRDGPHCGYRFRLDSSGLLEVGGTLTVAEFARYLQRDVGGLVQDETGLSGLFDIALTFKPDRSTFGGFGGGFSTSASADGLPLFAALEQQLGLMLESRGGRVEMLVVEHAQRPSPN